MEAFDAFIFDLDGTVVDSMGMWGQIDIGYLEKRGIPVPDNLQTELEGLGWTETENYFKEHFHLEEDLEEIGLEWLSMARDAYRSEIKMKPGADEFIRFLKASGKKLAIASSGHIELVREALKAQDLLDLMDVISTCEEAGAGKPDPAVYLRAAELLMTEPSKCIAFEDLPLGIEAAKAAGMTAVAVDDEYSKSQTNEKIRRADAFIRDFRELMNITIQE